MKVNMSTKRIAGKSRTKINKLTVKPQLMVKEVAGRLKRMMPKKCV